jgi:nitroimidazol reductase NimA-like FMN-containing flavoprotein (pyridoxamine 5'-phosphate oxidase superfamily)
MSQQDEFSVIARAIIDSNKYLVLGTADESGQPWVTPVYYASADYREFYWVSSPETQHSRNLRVRPQLSVVIFDSQVPINTGQAVYMSARAETLTGDELVRGLEIYSRTALAQGGRAWTKQDTLPPAPHRLYRATASEQWILDPTASTDRRVLVTP